MIVIARVPVALEVKVSIAAIALSEPAQRRHQCSQSTSYTLCAIGEQSVTDGLL